MEDKRKVSKKAPAKVKPLLAATLTKNQGYRHAQPYALVPAFKPYIPPRLGS